jgi:acyl-[acyl carrier protein]--UDP-N-acetylglucosamine O-acyltransferase
MRLALFRVGLIGTMTAVALAGWFVGGPAGAFIWIGGLLGIWGFTRVANFAMSGAFLREVEDEPFDDPDAEPDDEP